MVISTKHFLFLLIHEGFNCSFKMLMRANKTKKKEEEEEKVVN